MSQDLLELFRSAGALLEGHFLLTSGLHSPRYLQCARVLMDPIAATRLGSALATALGPHLREPPGAVVAPALGGVIVAHEVARALTTYRITLAYAGTDFAGWQAQAAGARTVQGSVEEALARLSGGERVAVAGAGRTDAGVHALGQVASFALGREWPPADLAR